MRSGAHVLRPSGRQTPSVHAYLRAITDAGFDGAPRPVEIEPDGQQRLTYIAGEVPTAPYPDWSQSDEALASIAGCAYQSNTSLTANAWDGTRPITRTG